MFTGPDIVTDGLVLALDAANVKSYPGSGTVWKDLSGNGFNDTFILTNGAQLTADNLGGIQVDGTNDYMLSNTFFTSDYWEENGDWTVVCFHKIDSAVTGNGRSAIFANQRYQTETSSGGPGGFGVNIISGNYCTNLTHDDGLGTTQSYEAHTLIPIDTGNLTHIAYTWDGSNTTVKGYKNGSLESTTTNATYKWSPRSFGTTTRIGISSQGGWGNYFEGVFYKLEVYNRALTEEEVLQNYNATKSRFNL